MEVISRYGIYLFDGREKLIFVLKYRNWTKKKIDVVNSLVLKYFLSDAIVYDIEPTGCIEIKRVYKRRFKNTPNVDVEKVVAGNLHCLSEIFKSLKVVMDKFYVQAPLA